MQDAKAKKRTWTLIGALEWIGLVEAGHEQEGLKYCSALDYLNGRLKGGFADGGGASGAGQPAA